MKYVLIILAGLFCLETGVAQSLTPEQTSFLKRNSKAICRDSLLTQPRWDVLLPDIKNKRIILLGECNHGSKEIFELRNSLIKYLHQEKGVKAVLFETGIGELISADINRANMSPSQMASSLVGVWRTTEFVELMNYVKANDISIAGFDVQRTGGSFATILLRVGNTYSLDSLYTLDLESRYGIMARELTNRRAVYDSLKASTTELIHDYQKVKAELSNLVVRDAPKDLLFTTIAIENRIKYLLYMLQFLKDKDWSRRWAARDSAMATNTMWLLNTIYKDEPVIIIGHNFHIGKYNEKETVMGEILRDNYGNDMYSIGFFAGSGVYSDNFGREVKMTPEDPDGLDIKHIISGIDGAVAFLDIPDKFDNGSMWLNQALTINDTFIDLANGNKMNLSKTFDGLILLKKVSPSKID